MSDWIYFGIFMFMLFCTAYSITNFFIWLTNKKSYYSKIAHSNWVHFNNSPLYHRSKNKDVINNAPNAPWAVGDCAVRACAFLFNKSWKQALKMMTEYSYKTNYLPNQRGNLNEFLFEHGFNITEDFRVIKKFLFWKEKKQITIEEFARNHTKPMYDYYVVCWGGGNDFHAVACRNGKYYDAFDSGKFLVCDVYTTLNINNVE